LDVGVGDAGAVGERRDWVVDLVLDEREHVGCRLAQVVVGGCFWKRHLVREPIDGECVSGAAGTWDVALVASVVVFRWANVPTVDAMRGHVGSLVWCDVCDHTRAGRRKWRLVEIEVAIEAGIGRQFGLAPGRA
jgi:hypothetical protein